MKPAFEDNDLLSEPLIKWLKTFKNEFKGAEFVNLSQLIGSDFLDNVMFLIKFSKKSPSADADVKLPVTVADRLHHLRAVLQQILDFYQNNLKQVIMLPIPNLVVISGALRFEDCENDLKLLLLLILGCATQCSLKDKFISRISDVLDIPDQEFIEKYFGQLANNSMTTDHSSLDLDDNMLQLHHQVTQLTVERRIYTEKYYDCFEKHSCDCLDEISPKSPVPILIQSVVPVSHGGQWELASPRKRFSGSADRKEDDVLVVRYRPTLKTVDKNNVPSVAVLSPADTEKLRLADEKIKQNVDLENELHRLRQQIHDLDFHKKKLKEMNTENSQLIADKQKLRDQLQASRHKEEDVIERLVDCQMKLDDTTAEREMDRQKIADLMKTASNRNNNNNRLIDEDSDVEPGKSRRIPELEREIESLRTRLMEAQKQDNQSDEKWKFLELQKEKVEARRQLNDAVEENEDLHRTVEKLENKVKSMDNDLIEAQDIANITRSANDDQVSQFEERIKDLTRQVAVLRRKGGKLSDDQFRDMDAEERDLMYESVQELSTEVTKLKAHNKILRQTCDKLKRDVDKVVFIEGENERLEQENRRLQQAFASKELNNEQIDELRKQNLQLAIENKKLRRIIDTLRFTLMQVDPANKQKYHYITSI